MEDVSIHAAALKAIEWFNLDSEAMKGSRNGSEDHSEEAEERESSKAQKPNSKEPPSSQTARNGTAKEDNDTPNKPLGFRLEKLEHNHSYLTRRGLTPETAIDFGAGFCPKGIMAARIAIPIHNVEGKVVAYAGRFPGEPTDDTPKYKLPPGFKKGLELFNIDRAIKESPDTPLVIVEGFFDCMKLHQNGCKKVVALMGSTMSAAQEELIRRYTNSQSRVIAILDEDEAGRAGREDIACRLSKFCFVKVHQFEKPGMQPEDLSAEELYSLLD